jgi:murein DD-endopeptidase MepM/ murein hydrolase activator NlpD
MRFREFRIIEAQADPEVIKLQQDLKAKGYDLGTYGPKGDGIDGIMGPYTQTAKDAAEKGIDPKEVKKPDTAALQKFDAGSGETPEPATGDDMLPTKGRLTGEYGRVVTGPEGNKIPHPGVDIAAPEGTPVVAPDNGKITLVRPGSPSAGNYIEMVTSTGERHRFMHLSKIEASLGDAVKKGDIIGRVGSTGFSTGNHLHWEKYASSGRQLNPLA